jgi:O-antigen/teichoic acid export membrane protein
MITAIVRYFPRLAGLDYHMKEVVRGAATAFVLRMLGTGFRFGFNVLLARLLGAEGVGVYYLALTVTSIATVVGQMGLDNALLRFTAANVAQKNWDNVAGVYRQGVWYTTGACVVVSAVVAGGADWIGQVIFDKPSLAGPLRLMALSILPMCLLTLYGELLKGLKKVGAATLVQSLGSPLVGIPLVVVLSIYFGVMGAALAHVLATILVLLLGIGLWRRATPQLRGIRGGFDTSLLVRTSLPLFGAALMSLVMSSTSTLMLGIWRDNQSVGIYGSAVRTAMLTSFTLVAVNCILAPKFAALYAQGDLQALGALARNAARMVTLLATPLLLLFIVAPRWVLGFFGLDFTAGAAALAILTLGQYISVAAGSVNYLLMMCARERLVRNTYVFSVVLNILLNALLIPPLGIIGAALATSVSLASHNLILAALAYRKLSIVTLPIPKWIFTKAG